MSLRGALPFRGRGGAPPELSAAGAAEFLLGLRLGGPLWLAPLPIPSHFSCLRPCDFHQAPKAFRFISSHGFPLELFHRSRLRHFACGRLELCSRWMRFACLLTAAWRRHLTVLKCEVDMELCRAARRPMRSGSWPRHRLQLQFSVILFVILIIISI